MFALLFVMKCKISHGDNYKLNIKLFIKIKFKLKMKMEKDYLKNK